MKILMLGNTESGKTTYMSNAYGLLQKPLYGFTVKAIDSSTHSWLIYLYNGLRKNHTYPAPTDKRTTYEFNLFYQGQSLINFEWKDVHGGIVDQSSSSEVREFISDIGNSDALMIFFEGESLLNNVSSRTRLRRICNLISNNIEVIEEDFYITILITKYDCLFKTDFDQVIAPLREFVGMAEENEKVHVNIIPVACTQNELLHVDLPLLTILYGGILNEYLSKANELNTIIEKAKVFQENSGIIDDIFSWVGDQRSYRQLAEEQKKKAIAKYEVFQKIDEASNRLGEFIEGYELFSTKNKYSTSNDIFSL